MKNDLTSLIGDWIEMVSKKGPVQIGLSVKAIDQVHKDHYEEELAYYKRNRKRVLFSRLGLDKGPPKKGKFNPVNTRITLYGIPVIVLPGDGINIQVVGEKSSDGLLKLWPEQIKNL